MQEASTFRSEVSLAISFLCSTGCLSTIESVSGTSQVRSLSVSWLQTHIATPLNLVSFFGLLPTPEDARKETSALEVAFRQYLFVHHKLWNEYPVEARDRLFRQ